MALPIHTTSACTLSAIRVTRPSFTRILGPNDEEPKVVLVHHDLITLNVKRPCSCIGSLSLVDDARFEPFLDVSNHFVALTPTRTVKLKFKQAALLFGEIEFQVNQPCSGSRAPE